MNQNTRGAITCRDYQLKPTQHEGLEYGQRYLSPTTGKCKKLIVQTVHSVNSYGARRPVETKLRVIPRLAADLVRGPVDCESFLLWPFKWILLQIVSPFRWWLEFIALFNGQEAIHRLHYKPYAGMYWGQFWAPRSQCEYSKHQTSLEQRPADQLQLPPLSSLVPRVDDPDKIRDRVVRAMSPRQLIRLVGDQWVAVTEGSSMEDNFFLATARYMAVSYRQTDFRDKHELIHTIRKICIERGWEAYWLDIECTGSALALGQDGASRCPSPTRKKKVPRKQVSRTSSSSPPSSPLSTSSSTLAFEKLAEQSNEDSIPQSESDEKTQRDMKNYDLYRIADVFRGAEETLIMIKPPTTSADSSITNSTSLSDAVDGWLSWGTRVWTFPEALLSKHLIYHIGDNEVRPISLRQLANIAFFDRDEASRIIDGYSGKDRLTRLEFLSMLKDAIWRRSSGPTLPPNSTTPPNSASFIAFPAEKVYALMGLFEHRIMPDRLESEIQALARLSMANDNNRIIERMAAMLPTYIPDRACWYAVDDVYKAKLWDIEPDVTAAGLTESAAIVLDGVRACSIRWKGFPRMHLRRKRGFRRTLAILWAHSALVLFIIGLALVLTSNQTDTESYSDGFYTYSYGVWSDNVQQIFQGVGGTFLAIGCITMLAAPFLLVYGNSGRVVVADSWLIGVEGVMTPPDVEYYLYGTRPFGSFKCKLHQSPTGSLLAIPGKGEIRVGEDADKKAKRAEDQLRDSQSAARVYTLVDSVSNTIYYFEAKQPPTVCLYVGREGGLGRYVLCSENCRLNELHKETVLRMPSYISHYMLPCDWVAVGSTSRSNNLI